MKIVYSMFICFGGFENPRVLRCFNKNNVRISLYQLVLLLSRAGLQPGKAYGSTRLFRLKLPLSFFLRPMDFGANGLYSFSPFGILFFRFWQFIVIYVTDCVSDLHSKRKRHYLTSLEQNMIAYWNFFRKFTSRYSVFKAQTG